MFKSVEYSGFDGLPELKAQAERLTPILASQVRRWREQVAVLWTPTPSVARDSLNLTLSLALSNGVSASALGTFRTVDLAEDWLQRSQCRTVWGALLGELLLKQNERVQELLLEPLEV